MDSNKVNVFIKKSTSGKSTPSGGAVSPRRRGRPPGPTAKGAATKRELYGAALRRIEERGYEATTLRDIAEEAGVSVGLLYRYFPSKRAVVLALYDDLTADFVERAARMKPGPWTDRFRFALETSLAALSAHRTALAALTSTLVASGDEGLFSPLTRSSRERVAAVFHEVVAGARDAPSAEDAAALGRVLYVAHLAVILWWLLDESPSQRATTQLVEQIARALPLAALAIRLPQGRRVVREVDALCRDALLSERARR